MFRDWGEKKVQRYLILASTLSFLLLTVAIVFVYNNPMIGYEFSVYRSSPLIFWIAIIISLIIGILLFYVNYGRNRALWAVGLFQILFSNFIFVTHYLYKGFIYIERFDSLTYVGYAKDIAILGNIPYYNFYPMGSIIAFSTGAITGQSLVLMSQIFPAIFLTAYSIGILCWSRKFSTKPLFVTSMMLASIPIFFAWYVPTMYHETWCVLMLPFFFFILWLGTSGNPWPKILAGIMMVFFIIGHPLVAAGVLLILIVILGTEYMMKSKNRMVPIPLVLYSMLLFLLWIWQNASLLASTEDFVYQLLGLMTGGSTASTAENMASSIGISSALKTILVLTIDDIIFVILTIWMGTKILRSGWKNHPMTVVFACFLLGSVFLVVIMLFTFTHTPFRMINLNFIMIFTIPIVGYLLYTFRSERKVALSRLVTMLILFCLVCTVFTVFQDPIENYPNSSITRSEVVGSDFLINAREGELTIYCIQTQPSRFASFIYGEVYNEENPEFQFGQHLTTEHFNSFLKSNDTGGTVFLTFSTYDVDAYTKTWAATDKFNSNDFDNLDLSTSVNHIYTNGCLTIYSRT
jgi:hypothetical protein